MIFVVEYPSASGDADDAAAAGLDDIAADDRVLAPVGAFDEDVGLQRRDDLVRRVFVEDHHRIDRRERARGPRRAPLRD